MTYPQNPLSLFWDNHYLPTDELHQKRQNYQRKRSVESCLCILDLTQSEGCAHRYR